MKRPTRFERDALLARAMFAVLRARAPREVAEARRFAEEVVERLRDRAAIVVTAEVSS